MKYVSVKTTQFDLHKCMIWLKNQGKVEKNGTCLCDSNFPQKKSTLKLKQSYHQNFNILLLLRFDTM